MKILLLGGNGYVGSALYPRLKSHDVASIDLCLFGQDLGYSTKRDVASLDPYFLQQFDTVIMLSGHSSVPLCKQDSRGSIINNVHNVLKIVDSLLPSQTLIYASSTGVYGQNCVNCAETQSSFQHHNWYDITKQTADSLIEQKIWQGRKIVALRFGTVCGTAPNTRADLFLNSMVLSALNNGSIWFNNGSSLRSVLAIDDLTSAVIAILKNGAVPGIYNVKSFDVSIAEAAHAVSKQLSVPLTERPDNSISYNFSVDHNKFCKTYCWQPSIDLEILIEQLQLNLPKVFCSTRNNWPGAGSYVISNS